MSSLMPATRGRSSISNLALNLVVQNALIKLRARNDALDRTQNGVHPRQC